MTNTNRQTTEYVPSLLISKYEVARLLGVCPQTVENLYRRRQLPSLRIGTRRMFTREDIQQFIVDSRATDDAALETTKAATPSAPPAQYGVAEFVTPARTA